MEKFSDYSGYYLYFEKAEEFARDFLGYEYPEEFTNVVAWEYGLLEFNPLDGLVTGFDKKELQAFIDCFGLSGKCSVKSVRNGILLQVTPKIYFEI